MKPILLICMLTLTLSAPGLAEEFDGVEFPDGAVSFADSVLSFTPGSHAEAPYITSSYVLGAPDYTGHEYEGYTSLGNGGILVVKFTDNSLTTSGNSDLDLWIFEIGGATEATDVYVSKDGVSWIAVGRVAGSTSGIDLDAYLDAGITAGEKYSYVKLIDDVDDDFQSAAYAGADIDAIGAISSDAPVPTADILSDTDNDGVIDQWDHCPDTPDGSHVDKNGCPADEAFCTQVITYGFSPSSSCWIEFPNPCVVPFGWETATTIDENALCHPANACTGAEPPVAAAGACASYDFFQNIFSVPCFDTGGGTTYWLDFSLEGASDELLFRLHDYGINE